MFVPLRPPLFMCIFAYKENNPITDLSGLSSIDFH